MKFCRLHENKQKPWIFANFMKLSKMSKNYEFLRLHKNRQKTMKLFDFIKISNKPWNFAIFIKYAKAWQFVNFIKISKNHEYLRISWKQGQAGQRCVHGHMKHMKYIKHIKHTKHIQQCQCWTAPMIFIEKTAHFRHFLIYTFFFL